jgi:alginate O-acetyltransferase complex protein AlgI
MFHLVCVGWVFFRAESFDIAMSMLSRLFYWQGGLLIGRRFALITLVCALLHVGAALWPSVRRRRPGPVVQGGLAALTAYALILLAADTAPFIYFQF